MIARIIIGVCAQYVNHSEYMYETFLQILSNLIKFIGFIPRMYILADPLHLTLESIIIPVF